MVEEGDGGGRLLLALDSLPLLQVELLNQDNVEILKSIFAAIGVHAELNARTFTLQFSQI